MNKVLYLSLLILFSTTFPLCGQQPKTNEAPGVVVDDSLKIVSCTFERFRKHTVSFTTDLRECFDGNAIIGRPSVQGRWLGYLGFGFDYEYHFDQRHGLNAALGIMGMWYGVPKHQSPSENLGIVHLRQMAVLSTAYLYQFAGHNRAKLYAIAGFNFRYGYEQVTHWDWGASDAVTGIGYYLLRDLGLVFGGRASYAPTRRLQLSSDLRFVEYIYRYDPTRLNQFTNYAGKGATRHLATLQLGLGYRF